MLDVKCWTSRVTQGDHPHEVPDNAKLWRRVSPIHVASDGLGPSSAAFAGHSDDGKTSVCVAEIAGTPDEMMEGWDGHWLVQFTVGDARSAGFGIEITAGEYEGHANLVWGGTRSARKRAQQKLAEACRRHGWIIRREDHG